MFELWGMAAVCRARERVRCVFVLVLVSWHVYVYKGSPSRRISKLSFLEFPLLGEIPPVCLYFLTYISLDFPLLERA